MRLAWMSNAPWCATGYGQQTALFAPRIAADGHDVAIAAMYGLAGAALDWNGIPVLPAGYDAHGNDLAPAHMEMWTQGRGWSITLYDVWPFTFGDLPNVASWTPVDHDPVPAEVVAWARKHYTIAMSRFGQAALAAAGVEARYVPHAIDPNVFRPTDTYNGRPARAAMGVPDDAFVVTINAANKGKAPPRKGWSEMFRALAPFMARHANVHLYLHTDIAGFYGVDLGALYVDLGLPGDRIHIVNQYAYRAGSVPAEALAAIYTASDVLLLTSYGEGFGIPVIEAQACGTPVIVTDATAMPELVADGWKVPATRWRDEGHRADFFIPKVDYIVDALEDAYRRGKDVERATEGMEPYHVATVYADHMRPVLRELEDMLDSEQKVIPLNREQRRAKR